MSNSEVGGMMGRASNRLRGMLAARGIEYIYAGETSLTTTWYSADGKTEYTARERSGGRFSIKAIHKGRYTLKRVREAMLRYGDCAIENIRTGGIADYECSEHIKHCRSCHHVFGYVLYDEDGGMRMDEQPRYCPKCGAKVVG